MSYSRWPPRVLTPADVLVGNSNDRSIAGLVFHLQLLDFSWNTVSVAVLLVIRPDLSKFRVWVDVFDDLISITVGVVSSGDPFGTVGVVESLGDRPAESGAAAETDADTRRDRSEHLASLHVITL